MFERRFMRFEISGFLSILYWFLFMACSFRIPGEGVKSINIYHIAVAAAAGLVAAPPIGFVLHQLDISLFCPFNKRRLGIERRSVSIVEKWKEEIGANVYDRKLQSIIVHAKTNDKAKEYKHYQYIQNEIDKRYSYYYGRWEAAVFSPVLGVLLTALTWAIYYIAIGKSLIDLSIGRVGLTMIILLIIAILGYAMIKYCKELLNEIDDLELSMVRQNETYIKDVLASMRPADRLG